MVYVYGNYSNGNLTSYGNIHNLTLEGESNTSATYAFEKVAFEKVTRGSSCKHVYTFEACEEAARQLSLGDTSAEDDMQYGVSHDPPYCYYEDGRLKFNFGGRNTGRCTSTDQCLCIYGNYAGKAIIKNKNVTIVKLSQEGNGYLDED